MHPNESKEQCSSMQQMSKKDIKKFTDCSIEEQIQRLHIELKQLKGNYDYFINLTHEMSQKIEQLQSHQHGVDGSVMVRPKQGHQGFGGGLITGASTVDILN